MRAGPAGKHYERQKGQCYAHFRVNREDADKIGAGQFTIYDFITGSFSFSPARRQAAISVLEALKKRPMQFSELERELGASKSSLYLLCLSLERSGLVEKAGGAYRPSEAFSGALDHYAKWWAKWLKD